LIQRTMDSRIRPSSTFVIVVANHYSRRRAVFISEGSLLGLFCFWLFQMVASALRQARPWAEW
jgi:hypothetical protein